MNATTTIMIATPKPRNRSRWVVFGLYQGPDDRYTFGVKYFTDTPEGARAAEVYAVKLQVHQDEPERAILMI